MRNRSEANHVCSLLQKELRVWGKQQGEARKKMFELLSGWRKGPRKAVKSVLLGRAG